TGGNPVSLADPSGTQAVDPSQEDTYAEGIDPVTGANERYASTPDLESHQYVTFQDDSISASPKPAQPKAAPKTGAIGNSTFIILGPSEPFDVQQWEKSIGEALRQTETPEYKLARALALAEAQRQAEYEAEQRKEAEVEKELPSFWVSLIPIYGSGKSSYVHFSHGNYGRGIFYAALAITDIALVKSLVVGGGKLLAKGAGALLAREAESTVVKGGVNTSKYVLRMPSGLEGVEKASPELLEAMKARGRTIVIAEPGSESMRYLEYMGAEANVGG